MSQFIRISKKTNSKIEQAKLLLKIFCILSDVKLSTAELTVLAYFIVYKITDETKDLIIKSQILSEDSLKNTMTKFTKFGLIKKSAGRKKEYFVTDVLNIVPEPTIGMLIKIDNS